MNELFVGTGIAHTILLFAVVIASGLWLGRFKVKGVSIGSTWILFIGIFLSHFGFRADPTVLNFMKNFGLILFVFAIGMQVGPGFFRSFRKGGVSLNLMAALNIVLAGGLAILISQLTGEKLTTMTGVMSGAVTNTPGLGAAQQTMSDVLIAGGADKSAAASAADMLASSYAVAYPIGVLGVIGLLILFKAVFKVDLAAEEKKIEAEEGEASECARRMHCEVENPAIFGKTLLEVVSDSPDEFIISRLMRGEEISIPSSDTVFQQGDKLLIVTSQPAVDRVRTIFGKEVPMHQADWIRKDEDILIRRLDITKSSFTGKRLRDLHFRSLYGVSVTRILRSGVQLVARPSLILEMGDSLQVVGPKTGIDAVAKVVGNKPEALTKPNLVPIFFGIALGVVFGSIPIRFPGIPQPIKLGLAGGPLIIAILLGHFGPKLKITTYTTLSANKMIREMGLVFFLAAVGLGAGENFVSSLLGGGLWWILYGALITIVPLTIVILISHFVLKFNFFQICGLVSGSTTNPPVLAFAQEAYGSEHTSVNYATVYPLSMFMRVLVAQLLILIAMS